MGVDNNTCMCDVDDNNQFRCSKSCKNFNQKCSKSSDCISKNKSKSKKTKSKKQKGGTNKIRSKRDISWIKNISNKDVRSKVIDIYAVYKKKPESICFRNNKMTSMVFENIEGFNSVEIFTNPKKKLHPYPAIVFVIAKKYIHVPDYLLGALKYASETINIEQLMIDDKYNNKYQKTGKKEVALVSGSCATLTISAITLKFVEDMVDKYNKNAFYRRNYKDICQEFRDEYDKRVGEYLCGKGIVPKIKWFHNKVERNDLEGPWDEKIREKMGCPDEFKGSVIANKNAII
jgi:hypothetical protein